MKKFILKLFLSWFILNWIWNWYTRDPQENIWLVNSILFWYYSNHGTDEQLEKMYDIAHTYGRSYGMIYKMAPRDRIAKRLGRKLSNPDWEARGWTKPPTEEEIWWRKD